MKEGFYGPGCAPVIGASCRHEPNPNLSILLIFQRMLRIVYLVTCLMLFACSHSLPDFRAEDQPEAPDYSQEKSWSALPFRDDAPDIVPYGEEWVHDSLKPVDVFYIYPTIYQKGKTWNADVDDGILNRLIDLFPVRLQASVFNHVGRVYVPRYRQGIYLCFRDTTGNGLAALDFAYEDVKRAFIYFLEHYNRGRPVIIASHSQGTTHARRLISEFFDTPETASQLVCAYIVGFGVYPDHYAVLEPCRFPEQTHCFVTWATFREGHIYDRSLEYYGKVQVNPVSWRIDTLPATTQGGKLLRPGSKQSYTTTVRIEGEYLWANTNMPLYRRKDDLHLVDFSLFWLDIRRNATLRVETYLQQRQALRDPA